MFGVESLLEGVSVVGALLLIGAIVFAESGLLIGLFLPGDTLLFTAGFFAAQGQLPIAWVLIIIFVAAVLGDNLGYFVGEHAGPRIFRKKDGIFFRQDYLERAKSFYARHGGKTVMFARFVPYVRTFAPMVAGAAKMRHLKFILYNITGAFLWTVTFVMLGYWLGIEIAEQVNEYLLPAFIVGIVFALSPTILYVVRNGRFRAYVARTFGRLFKRR
jgi:membrane-associated protein